MAHITIFALPNRSVGKESISTDLEPIWLASPETPTSFQRMENFEIQWSSKLQVTFGF